ncbi:helix-turn-helix domain-containing protein [Desulfospira joergensenii]|uniref:helix-turn-helix domain-containing protein n=1 Tax=Desulfospira joergensenii TaxID=53329 RepID=UPI0003B63BFD|nr:helix-turn-helix domain-containing protein [Desulfospira joergensenii]
MVQQIGFIKNGDKNQLKGVPLDRVFRERSLDIRPLDSESLKKCLDFVRPGDTLHIESMDKLGSDLTELKRMIDLFMEKDVIIHFHKENIIFSNDKEPANQAALNLFNQTVNFHKETGDKLLKKVNGRRVRKFISGKDLNKAMKMIESGIPRTKVAEKMGISRSTLYKRLKEREQGYETL